MNWFEKRYYKVRRFLATRNQRPISADDMTKLQQKNSEWFKTDLNLEKYTVDASTKSLDEVIEKASGLLSKHGLVVVTGLVDNTEVKEKGQNLKAQILNWLTQLGDQDFVEDDDMLIQMGECKVAGYRPIANYPKPVATVRRKGKDQIDGGMFDMFGVDKMIDKQPELKELYDVLKSGVINKIVQKTSTVQQHQMNVYFNRDVVKTRHLHVDSVNESYKSFMYLMDVNSVDDGPYMYVPDSPYKDKVLFKSFMANAKYSDLYNIQDIYLPYNKAIPILGKAGTIAISNQKGIHGGHPQKEGHERLVLVDSYYD